MRRKIKIWMYIVSICITTIGGLFFCNHYINNVKKNSDTKKEEEIVKIIRATYRYNVNNLSNIVADADYVFVAKVDRVVNTVYRNPVRREDMWISRPYTKYKLNICSNIKGKLNTKKNVTIYKAGGKEKNSNVKCIYDKDRLPSKGKYYVFMAYVQKDGSLLVSGANSTLALGRNYKTSENYKKVILAYKNRRSMNRVRYSIKSKKVYSP